MSPVGPLVSQIKSSLALSAGFAGLLTTIPMLIFGIVAPVAGKLISKINDRVLVSVCLLLILVGILTRSYLGTAGLITGTALLGLGIGILNVLIPVFIRANFPRKIGIVMGTYTTSMTLLSALSAGFCVTLSMALGGWSNALAAFVVFPILALPAWIIASNHGFTERKRTESMPIKETAKSGRYWCAALFMTLQSALFFCMIAWLPSMMVERGASTSDTGYLILIMQLASLITNFLMPVFMQRFKAKRGLLAVLCGIVYAAGFSVLLFGSLPAWARISSVIFLGLGSGLSFGFALTLITILGKTQRETAGLSAFAQGVGYLFSAPMPVLLGAIYDHTGNFYVPALILLLICVPMVITGWKAVRKHNNIQNDIATSLKDS
jgi:CP family cyanate transporter-like MFS transporter